MVSVVGGDPVSRDEERQQQEDDGRKHGNACVAETLEP